MLRPTMVKQRILDVRADDLRALHSRLVLLDVDNTLSRHGEKEPAPGVSLWIEEMKQNGFSLLILSNNTAERVAPLAGQLGLPFFSMCMKPLPFCYWKACRQYGVPHRQAVLIGDQIFTDVLGGRLCGIPTVLLTPIEEETSLSFRIRRRLEKPLRRRYAQQGDGMNRLKGKDETE